MKTKLPVVFILLVLATLSFSQPLVRSEILQIFSYSPCDTPLYYTVSELDPKFGKSLSNIQEDIKRATDVWSNLYGKPLFVNSPNAVLTLHFVYDQRSSLSRNISKLQQQLDEKNSTLQQQVNSYKTDVSAFEKKLASFNATVDELNRSGGATQEVYSNLLAQQKALNEEGDALNARASQLNLGARNYNASVQNLNQNVGQFNQEIAQKPEEGLYNGNDNTITIYFVDNKQELIHTLAHEFGHALGMIHTDDQKDIMYPSSTSILTPTEVDKGQLTYVCRKQLLPLYWLQVYSDWIRSIIRSFPLIN